MGDGDHRAPVPAAAPFLRLLGTPALMQGGGAPRPLGRHDAALLGILALDGPTPRTRMAALLWPDSDARLGRLGLRQRIHKLKRHAGCDLVVGDPMLALAPEVAHDLATFDSALAADPDAARGEFLGALDFGDADELASWVDAARARWRERRAARVAAQAEALATEGRLAAALAYAARAVDESPATEHAHRRLMRFNYLRGDPGAALAAYARCVEHLARELGTQPGPETRALAESIERGALRAEIAPAPAPVSILRPPRLVGRGVEWKQLTAATLVHHGTVVVWGEAGIGKTRLAGDFAAAVGAGARFVAAQAGDSLVPYALLARVLRSLMRDGATLPPRAASELAHLLPELATPPPGPIVVLALHRAIVESAPYWRSAGTTLLIVDDLPSSDPASLAALLALADAADGPAVLFTARPDEAPAALHTWLARRSALAVHELPLSPLSEDAVREFLESLALPGLDAAAWIGPLARHTGGNPLFLTETLLELLDGTGVATVPAALPLPRKVGTLIGRRLRRLAPPAQRLAQLGALAGPDFSAALAARVLGVHALDLAGEWRELEAAGILRDGGFAHDLIREATARGIPATIAAELQREIARAAAALGAPAARVAAHAWSAGDWAFAASALPAAAAAAFRSGQRGEEMKLLDRLAACCDRQGDFQRAFEARRRAFDAALVAESLQSCQARLAALESGATSDLDRAEGRIAAAQFAIHASESTGAIAAAEAAQALLAAAPRNADGTRQRQLSLQARIMLGAGQARAGRAHDALATLERCAADAPAADSARLLQTYWSIYGFVLNHCDRRRDAVAAFERSIELAVADGDLADAMTDSANLAVSLAQLGDCRRALEAAENAEAWRERLGLADAVAALQSRMNAGVLYLRLGRYRQALAALDDSLAGFRAGSARNWTVAAENHLASAWLALGQTARARRALTPVPEGTTVGVLRRGVIECRIDRPDGPAALARLQALAPVAALEIPVNRLAWQVALPEFQPGEQAQETCRQVEVEATRLELDAIALQATIRRADALRRSGRHRAAADLAAVAQRGLDAGCHPHDMSIAEFCWLAGQVFAAASRRRAAAAVLERGLAWVERVARDELPDALRDAFLHRHPVHRAMRAAAAEHARRR